MPRNRRRSSNTSHRGNNKNSDVTGDGDEVNSFPELHDTICEAVACDDLLPTWVDPSDHNRQHHTEEYGTNVMGSFQCPNPSCSTDRWTSKIVAIVIRGYPGGGYNADVFSQRCRACNSIGSLKLDEQAYVERVAYRLKKWAGVKVDAPPYSNAHEGRPPHEQELCEGCKRGYCMRGRVGPLY